MGFIANKVQAWKDHRAALDKKYIAEGGLHVAELSGNEEMQQRARAGLTEAEAERRQATDKFWGRLVR